MSTSLIRLDVMITRHIYNTSECDISELSDLTSNKSALHVFMYRLLGRNIHSTGTELAGHKVVAI